MPSYKLSYFPVRARAELPRYVFAAAGVKFEDKRISSDEWPKYKQSMPFRQMPVLEVDGKQLSQGYAITRYLATEFGLAGKDKWEVAQADQYTGVVEDLFVPTARIKFEEDAKAKAAYLKKFLEETGPSFLEPIETALSKSTSGFLVGGSLTYADLAFLALFEFVEGTLGDDGKGLIKRFPNILKFRQNIAALPKIAAWISKRPKSDF